MIVSNIIFILIFLILLFFSFLFFSTPFFSKVPFIPTRNKALKEIILALGLSDDSVLYDLGCGDGRLLFLASKTNKNISCVGVERAPFPYVWAKIRQAFSKNKNVSIVYGNMFKKDISDATHVFVYLFPELMDELLPKFEKELKPGTRVVSSDFKFSKRNPDQIIDIKSKKRQLNRRLFIYNF